MVTQFNNIEYTLPANNGPAGATLTNDGTGMLSWQNTGLKYLGKLQVDVGSSGTPMIPNGTWTTIDWMTPYVNYAGALNLSTDIVTIPNGVSKIRITMRITFQNFPLNNSTVHFSARSVIALNGSDFGWAPQRISTYNDFLMFNGFNFSSSLLEVAPGDVLEFKVFQNNGNDYGLGWGAVNNTYLVIEYYE